MLNILLNCPPSQYPAEYHDMLLIIITCSFSNTSSFLGNFCQFLEMLRNAIKLCMYKELRHVSMDSFFGEEMGEEVHYKLSR